MRLCIQELIIYIYSGTSLISLNGEHVRYMKYQSQARIRQNEPTVAINCIAISFVNSKLRRVVFAIEIKCSARGQLVLHRVKLLKI